MEGGQAAAGERPGWLERLALHRPQTRAWALYDWANSAFFTVVITAVFPVYFGATVASGLDAQESRRVFGLASTIALAFGALLSPPVGTLADCRPWKKRLFALWLTLGVAATAGLAWVGPGDVHLGLWLFGLANVGAMTSFVLYDALLVHVARDDEVDRLSTSAYALGYLGGGLCLALALAILLRPGWIGLPAGEGLDPRSASLPARASFVLVAAWWAAFSLPLFRSVREPALPPTAALEAPSGLAASIGAAFGRLGRLVRELRGHPQAFLMLCAFLIYGDGIGTLIRMAALFGVAHGLSRELLLGTILGVQFVGIPCAIGFGKLADRIGTQRAILVGLAGYALACGVALRMQGPAEFLLLALLVAMVQGGTQALSRSLFASLIPAHRSGEFFGLFAALERFAGVLGPFAFWAIPSLGGAIAFVLGLFVVGALLLARVDVERGRAEARAAEHEAGARGPAEV